MYFFRFRTMENTRFMWIILFQEVVLFKKSPDEDLGIIAEDGKDGSAIIKEVRPVQEKNELK